MGVPTGPETIQRVDAEFGETIDLPNEYAAKLIASGAAIDEALADSAERIAGDVEKEIGERALASCGPRVIDHSTGKEAVIGGYSRHD